MAARPMARSTRIAEARRIEEARSPITKMRTRSQTRNTSNPLLVRKSSLNKGRRRSLQDVFDSQAQSSSQEIIHSPLYALLQTNHL